ncbi:MAG: hypothetical protein KDA28_08180, partial [Phycisphaerales bacterium]|nr:hypothetical protein [Phycisphaerales bacterium]
MRRLVLFVVLLFVAPVSWGQVTQEPYGPSASTFDDTPRVEIDPGMPMNPASVLDQVGRSLPSQGTTGLSAALNVMVLLTVITLGPSIVLMTTCFMRILIVLGLLKQAMGAASVPPAQVVTGLALFMTVMVMAPTAERVWTDAIEPFQRGEITSYEDLWIRGRQPLRDYMIGQIEYTG